MLCRNCGKELAENAKFCSGCGAAVKGTAAAEETVPVSGGEIVPETGERNVSAPVVEKAEAAPADETPAAPVSQDVAAIYTPVPVAAPAAVQSAVPVENEPVLSGSKRRGKELILLAVIAVVLVALVIGAVKVIPAMFGGKDVYLYLTEDEELMSLKKLKANADAVELTDDGALDVYFSKDGKYFYFFTGTDGVYGCGDLYRMESAKIGKKGAEPEKVASEVQYNIDLLDSGDVVYLKGSGSDAQLRLYDGKESFKLASDVTDFFVNEKQTHAYFTEEDYDGLYVESTLYRVELKKDGKKEKLLNEVGQIYGNCTGDMIVYGEYIDDEGLQDIYIAKSGEKGSKVQKDVLLASDVEISGQKVSFTFVTMQEEKHVLYDFVTDRMAASDKDVREPDYSDYGYYDSWGWWETDWEAYNAAWEDWYDARDREDLREYLKSAEYNIVTYTLSRYENGEITKVAEGLDSIEYQSDPESKVYIYTKSGQEVTKVADLADLEYYDQVYQLIAGGERTWYQNVKGTESELDIEGEEYISDFGVLNGKEVILVAGDYEEMAIRSYSIGDKELKFTETIVDDDFANPEFREDKNDKDALYYFTNLNKDETAGELVRYVDGKKESLAKDAGQVKLLENGAVFKMEDIEYNERSGTYECTLYASRDGKDTKISDEIWMFDLVFMDAKKIAYISDGDLYVWNGSDSEKIASDVTCFWTNTRIPTDEINTFYCDYYY